MLCNNSRGNVAWCVNPRALVALGQPDGDAVPALQAGGAVLNGLLELHVTERGFMAGDPAGIGRVAAADSSKSCSRSEQSFSGWVGVDVIDTKQ
jgi:hypothetical protein